MEGQNLLTPNLLVFDLDDTLVDWSERSWHAKEFLSQFLALETGYPAEEWLTALREPDGGLWQKVTRGELPHAELQAARIRRLLVARSCDSDELVERACTAYRHAMVGRLQLDERVRQLLASLNERYRIYLLTNGLADFQWLTLRELALEAYFDQILICSDLRAYKPERAVFETVLRHANCAPGETWMIGDSWADDMVPALELGMTTVWINPQRQEAPDARQPHFDIPSVLELRGILG